MHGSPCWGGGGGGGGFVSVLTSRLSAGIVFPVSLRGSPCFVMILSEERTITLCTVLNLYVIVFFNRFY